MKPRKEISGVSALMSERIQERDMLVGERIQEMGIFAAGAVYRRSKNGSNQTVPGIDTGEGEGSACGGSAV